MAPVKISHIVSFSSQDPRYPVENLLCPDGRRPWLSCPQERSRQLRVELQLERAVPIGYIDIGNWGCAFLQIEVGRSSWPLDRPFLTLVPSVALMTPADSKLDRNRCGVRMFKEADFLAVGQKWDRLRLTCSQPFRPHGQFGLCFIRVRTPLDPELCPPAVEHAEPTGSPQRSNPASFCRIFSAGTRPWSSQEEEQLKIRLQQLEPSTASHTRSPTLLSRPARMVLQRARSTVGRSTLPLSSNPRAGGRAGKRGHDASRVESSGGETALCPICSGSFSSALLPAHASLCGEEDSDCELELLPSASSPVQCPICGLCFGAAEVEQHCSTCGE
ncbi:protein XNDC1N [Cyrtonyx montezumae]|uniref:protein XNDC1N n=1 Tax=Cyrtonyx montezumae TaxID=9017 RepID=UPI0032DAECF7